MMQLDSHPRTKAITKPAECMPEVSTSEKATPVTSRVCRWLTPILYFLGRRIVIPFYFRQLQVVGQENIPKSGSVILAPTHRSRWDGLLIAYAAGKPVTGREWRYMVSADEMKGIQGWFIRRLGGFPVNTKQPGVGSIRHGVELLRNGGSLVIFPEGNIFQDGILHPLKPGMARIAMQVESGKSTIGLKIVPVSIRFSQHRPHWGCDATVTIGSPINVIDYCTKSSKKGAQQLTHDLEAVMRDLDEGNASAIALPVPMH